MWRFNRLHCNHQLQYADLQQLWLSKSAHSNRSEAKYLSAQITDFAHIFSTVDTQKHLWCMLWLPQGLTTRVINHWTLNHNHWNVTLKERDEVSFVRTFAWQNLGLKDNTVQWNGFFISAPSGRGKDFNLINVFLTLAKCLSLFFFFLICIFLFFHPFSWCLPPTPQGHTQSSRLWATKVKTLINSFYKLPVGSYLWSLHRDTLDACCLFVTACMLRI